MPEKGDIHIKSIKRTTRTTTALQSNITFISYTFRYYNANFKEINRNFFYVLKGAW